MFNTCVKFRCSIVSVKIENELFEFLTKYISPISNVSEYRKMRKTNGRSKLTYAVKETKTKMYIRYK